MDRSCAASPAQAAAAAALRAQLWTAAPHPAAKTGKQDAQKIHDYIVKSCKERIMVIDGAMGTTVQQYKFSEEDFRGALWEMLADRRAA